MITDDYSTAVTELQKLMSAVNASRAVNMINLAKHIPDMPVASSSVVEGKQSRVIFEYGKWLVESIYSSLVYTVTFYGDGPDETVKCDHGLPGCQLGAVRHYADRRDLGLDTHSARISASSHDGAVQDEWFTDDKITWQQVIRNGLKLPGKGGGLNES